MKPNFNFFISLVIFIFVGCKNSSENKNELSADEQHRLDSLSKISQKTKSDSLKKLNPLLILPPDSTYSGEYLDKYPSGIVKFKGTFRLGERHGQWMSFYPNGTMWSEMHYDKGLRHGPNITYYENGKIRYSGFYSNDKVDSLWTYFDTTGVVVEKLLYKANHTVQQLPIK